LNRENRGTCEFFQPQLVALQPRRRLKGGSIFSGRFAPATGGAAPIDREQAMPPCHKSIMVGLTCRSAPISKRRGSRGRLPHHPISCFVHGCELFPAWRSGSEMGIDLAGGFADSTRNAGQFLPLANK